MCVTVVWQISCGKTRKKRKSRRNGRYVSYERSITTQRNAIFTKSQRFQLLWWNKLCFLSFSLRNVPKLKNNITSSQQITVQLKQHKTISECAHLYHTVSFYNSSQPALFIFGKRRKTDLWTPCQKLSLARVVWDITYTHCFTLGTWLALPLSVRCKRRWMSQERVFKNRTAWINFNIIFWNGIVRDSLVTER